MAFRYSLLTILRLRQSRERQEEQKLFSAAGTVTRLRTEIERLEEEHLGVQRANLMCLREGGPAAELQFASECRRAYERLLHQLGGELRIAEARRLEQMKAYRNARQKREVLDGLRERQEAAYNLEWARREQRNADELFLGRISRESSDQNLPGSKAESA
jgi:flagellar export protein FliJ